MEFGRLDWGVHLLKSEFFSIGFGNTLFMVNKKKLCQMISQYLFFLLLFNTTFVLEEW